MLGTLATPAGLSLIVLVIQNSALVLMTRMSKQTSSQPGEGRGPVEPYHTSTVVLNQEIVKLVLCVALFMREWRAIRDKRVHGLPSSPAVDKLSQIEGGAGHEADGFLTDPCSHDVWHELKMQVWNRDTLKLLIPAALFTMQNYLLFISLTYLDAMTFQMLSQSKLISAAVLSVWLLDKKLVRMQWASLFLLTFGVYLSQGYQSATPASANDTVASPVSTTKAAVVFQPSGTFYIGALACVLSGVSSSFAGVYFEKVVKTTPPSLAVRNIHLSLFGIPLALMSMVVIDVIPAWLDSTRKPFRYWQGYTPFTVCLVLVHALGGLLVAVVVKYADNILKGFATAVAIVVSGFYMMAFWSYVPSTWFIGGCGLVCTSTILYQVYEPTRGNRPPPPRAV